MLQSHSKYSCKKRIFQFFCLQLILWPAAVTLDARTFEWKPLGPEIGFFIDIPDNWEHDHIKKENGAIVNFRRSLLQKGAIIEVRSLVNDQKVEYKKIINQKAARLAAEYSRVRLVEEKPSRLRNNVVYSTWELQLNQEKFIERSAILIEEDFVVIVSCLSPLRNYEDYRVIFENALLSIRLGESDEEEDPFIEEEDLTMLLKLKELFLFNRPNAVKTIIPPKAAIENIQKQIENSKAVVKK